MRFRLLLAAASLIAAGAARGDGPPNVLFIAVDDLRPAIRAQGDSLAITPNLDRLAASGVIFENAYCQQAVCHPSRASLLTGLRPDTLGIYDLNTPIRDRVPDVVTLPQLFRMNGYRVIGRGKIFHGHLDDPASWDSSPSEGQSTQGALYTLKENQESGAAPPGGNSRPRRPAFERADVPDTAYADGILAEQAAVELKDLARAGKPFFYALGFHKPHLPFNAPEKYWAMHDADDLWPPLNRSLPEGVPSWISQPGWELRNAYDVPSDYNQPLGEALEKTLRHGYYAAVSYVDAQIGRVLDALDRLDLAGKTVVVLWGDHGYHVGDHGTWCKHTNFEIAVHSPLILRVPGGLSGGRVAAPVEFLDIYPTLADLCGLRAPERVEGETLVPLLREPEAPRSKAFAFSQYPRGGREKPMMGYSVRFEKWRYTEWIRSDTGEIEFQELYDLERDPHVTANLAAEPGHEETKGRLSKLIEQAGKGVAAAREKRKK